MPNFAQATFAGHLGRDPSTKQLNSNTVTEFVIAVTPSFPKDAPTMWIDCKAWGRKGEVIGEFHNKGDAILVSGSLRMEEWEAKDGSGKRSKFVLDVSEFGFIKKDGGGDSQPQQRQGSGHGGYDSQPIAGGAPLDPDLIPF